MSGYDAVVVGAGIVGASVAHALARAGVSRVLVCERGRPPGLGATTRSGSLLRQHHTARCDVELAVLGVRMFRQWSTWAGGDCGYRRTGFAVFAGAGHGEHLKRNVAAVTEAGGDSRVVDGEELTALHPGLRVPPDVLVGYEPDGGYADPVLATTSLLAAAGDRGVTVAEGVDVTGITTTGDRVTGVRTSLGTFEAPTVVLCGGAWDGELTRRLDVPLPVEPRRIGIARAATGLPAGSLPIGIDDTLGTYFRPVPDGGVYFGVSLDPECTPGTEPAPVTAGQAAEAAGRLAARIPALADAPLAGARAGFDGYTPDKRPAIGWWGPTGLYACTGFSGGGVKVAPAVADLVAREIVDGSRSPLLDPYRPQRFAEGRLIESEFPYVHL